jgi:AIG1 family
MQAISLPVSGMLFEPRNVIVLGKTGVGKSSLCNALIGSEVFPVSDSVASTTRKCESRTGLYTAGSVVYQVKMIDTLGFFDTKLSNSRTAELLSEFIKSYHTGGLHLILFVYRHGKYTQEEKACFSYILSHLKPVFTSLSALVITGCECLSPAERAGVICDFCNNDETREFASMMGRGIYTVGFPNLERVRTVLRPAFEETIEEDRRTIRELVVRSNQEYLRKEIFALKEQLDKGTLGSWRSLCTIL